MIKVSFFKMLSVIDTESVLPSPISSVIVYADYRIKRTIPILGASVHNIVGKTEKLCDRMSYLIFSKAPFVALPHVLSRYGYSFL